jgi:hypothetical protein
MLELYLHSNISRHGIVLNEISTGTLLPCLFTGTCVQSQSKEFKVGRSLTIFLLGSC